MVMSPTVKAVGDVASVTIAAGTLVKFLPAAAALFTLLWTYTRLHEAFTGQPFSNSRFARWITGRA